MVSNDKLKIMQKDFDKWNKIKKEVDETKLSTLYHAREIWWCSLGVNIGFEQNGGGQEYQRPTLILKGMSRDTCYVIPLTGSPQKNKNIISIGLVDGVQATAIISQIRLIDTKRLVEKIRFLDKNKFNEIRKAVKDLF